MKIINLLNKIANGEDVPEKIFYANQHWINKYPNDYEGIGYGGCLLNNVCLNNLNDEVEIIEEDKEIEKIKSLHNVGNSTCISEFTDKQHLNNHLLKDKINELIDKVNNLQNK